MNHRRWLALFLVAALPAFAIGADELFDRVATALDQAPWQVRMQGSVVGPGGSAQEADMIVKAAPGEDVVRIEFLKPDALADNYVVITPEKVYNYLFLTNQVVVYPRERARIEGLGFDLSRMGDLRQLGEKGEVVWEAPRQVSFDGRPAWRVSGRASDPDASGFARVEVWIARASELPLRTVFFAASGEPLSDLSWIGFARTKFSKQDLLSFPPDAEWIEK